jgi:hypothetical protein
MFSKRGSVKSCRGAAFLDSPRFLSQGLRDKWPPRIGGAIVTTQPSNPGRLQAACDAALARQGAEIVVIGIASQRLDAPRIHVGLDDFFLLFGIDLRALEDIASRFS